MDFTDKFKEYDTEKLVEIVTTLRKDYNPKAVAAAEDELKQRKKNVSAIVKDYNSSKLVEETQKYSKSGENIKPNKQRSKIAITLIWIVMVIDVIALFSNYFEYNLAQKVLHDDYVSRTDISANESRQLIIEIIYWIASVLSAVTFILWFRRAYYNLHELVEGLTYDEGWAAGSWFVPIINVYRPYVIMKELYLETKNLLTSKKIEFNQNFNTASLSYWWGLWIITMFIGNIVTRYSESAETLDVFAAWTLLSMVLNVIMIPCSIITVKVIKDYSMVESLLMTIKDSKKTD